MNKEYFRISAIIFFVTTAVFSTIYTPQAILPNLREDFQLTIPEVNLLLSVMIYILMLGTPIYAPLSKKLGYKKTMVFATLLLMIPTLVASFVSSYSWFLVSRIVQGLFVPGVTAVMLAYIQVMFSKEQVGLAMGMYMSAASLGGVLGRLLTGWITELYSWRSSFLFFAAILAIGLILMIFWLPRESKNGGNQVKWTWLKIRSILFDFQILSGLMIPAVVFFSFMSISTFSTFYLVGHPFDLSPGQLGSTFLVLFLGVIVSPIAGKWSDKVGRVKVILVGMTFLIIGAVLTLFTNLLIIILGLGLVTMGMFVAQSAAPTYIGELIGQEKTVAAVFYQMFFYFGGAMGTLLPSFIWPRFEYLGVVLFTEGVILLGLTFLVFQIGFSRMMKHQQLEDNL